MSYTPTPGLKFNTASTNVEDIPPTLRKHRQLASTCAVSAMECVAKLHGLIAPDSFPYQNDPTLEWKGFDDTSFLTALGFVWSQGHFDTQSALELISKETKEGRFPLVSLAAWREDGAFAGHHIYLCVSYNNKVVLVDPQLQSIVASGEDLATALETNRKLSPERDTLHLMWYQRKCLA